MGRVKIDLPSSWDYSCKIQVRVTDLNYGNHLANQNVLGYAQQARIGWFARYGCTELDFFGVSLIQADAAVVYKCEGHLNDEITIEVTAEQTGRAAFDVFYRMTNHTKGKVLAELKTAIVCFDYETSRPVSIPAKAIESGIFLRK